MTSIRTSCQSKEQQKGTEMGQLEHQKEICLVERHASE
jgi:hypothetical protein